MEKKLALTMSFSEEDLNVGLAMMAKSGSLPEGATLDYFTEGEPVNVLFEEIDESQSLSMCLAMMTCIVYGKEKQKEAGNG